MNQTGTQRAELRTPEEIELHKRRIAPLYFRDGKTIRQIAAETELTFNQVRRTIEGLREDAQTTREWLEARLLDWADDAVALVVNYIQRQPDGVAFRERISPADVGVAKLRLEAAKTILDRVGVIERRDGGAVDVEVARMLLLHSGLVSEATKPAEEAE